MQKSIDYLIPKDKPLVFNRSLNNDVRAKLQRDIKRFIDNGGCVCQVPTGQSGHDFRYEKGKRHGALRSKDPSLRRPPRLDVTSRAQ